MCALSHALVGNSHHIVFANGTLLQRFGAEQMTVAIDFNLGSLAHLQQGGHLEHNLHGMVLGIQLCLHIHISHFVDFLREGGIHLYDGQSALGPLIQTGGI